MHKCFSAERSSHLNVETEPTSQICVVLKFLIFIQHNLYSNRGQYL